MEHERKSSVRIAARIFCMAAFLAAVLLIWRLYVPEPADMRQAEETAEPVNRYTTRLGKATHNALPTFAFDYPSGWNIQMENMSADCEYVEIVSDSGTIISYQYLSPAYIHGSMRVVMGTKMQMISVSSLKLDGQEFVVAKTETTSVQNIRTAPDPSIPNQADITMQWFQNRDAVSIMWTATSQADLFITG